MFSMSQGPANEDGQLHTLGLLERLRAETRGFEGAYSKLSERVDRLLRELSNPNLHDIANMNFRVELWDRYGQHIRWVVAASGTVTIGHAAFEAAVASWPNEHFTLRNGILVIREHAPALGKSG
jgi:hypothetical protein